MTSLEKERKELVKKKNANKNLVSGIDAAWNKLNKYFKLTDLSPAYAAATICDPRRKLEYFENFAYKGHPEWIAPMKHSVEAFYKDNYKGSPTDIRTTSTAIPAMTYTSWPYPPPSTERATSSTMVSEWLDYLSIPRIAFDSVTPVQWWIDNRSRFPTLSKMALELLRIPAMSAEVESIFSR
jgi:hAT family C-terminal dimerisation region